MVNMINNPHRAPRSMVMTNRAYLRSQGKLTSPFPFVKLMLTLFAIALIISYMMTL